MRVAVVGGGVSGLAAAHELVCGGGGRPRVTVYEAEEALGGHARTADVDGVQLDLGFMVFNRVRITDSSSSSSSHRHRLSSCLRQPALARLRRSPDRATGRSPGRAAGRRPGRPLPRPARVEELRERGPAGASWRR